MAEDVRPISRISPSTCWKIRYDSRSDTLAIVPAVGRRQSLLVSDRARLLEPHRSCTAPTTAASRWTGAAAGRADRRRAGRARRLRPPAPRPRPGHGQPADHRLHRPDHGSVRCAPGPGPGPAPAEAGAVPVLADRARPRPPRRRHRRGAAPAAPRPRDRLAGPAPGDRRARGRGRADPPGQPAGWPTSPPTSTRESAEHDLHCFQALRRMDEILVANFMVFQEVVEEEPLRPVSSATRPGTSTTSWHENPELKRGPYVWLTDFVGWLPMPDGGEREAFLTADYNAEMIEHIDRYPWIRDRADLRRQPRRHRARHRSAPGLPAIRDWTEAHFSFSGYVTGFTPPSLDEPRRAPPPARLPATTSWSASSPSAAAASAGHLLDEGHRRLPAGQAAGARLRMVVVDRPPHRPGVASAARRPRGPRLRPPPLPAPGRLRPRRRPGRADHHAWSWPRPGGRSSTSPSPTTSSRTSTSATACDRYGAGRCMDYATTDPDVIAAAIAERDRPPGHLPRRRDRRRRPRRPTHRRTPLTLRGRIFDVDPDRFCSSGSHVRGQSGADTPRDSIAAEASDEHVLHCPCGCRESCHGG